MDMNNLGIFKLMSRKLDWLTQRQEVLGHNIANADTPEFRPSDLTPFTFKKAVSEASRLSTAVTNVAHMQGQHQPGVNETRESRSKDAYEMAPDGNSVVLEDQMMKVADTGMNYQMITNLYRKQVGMVRMALGKGGV
jgi:flagellar basal-body rod protein FlgB